MNYENINIFTSGLSFDLTQRAEKNETFQHGSNGRLYTVDGILAFSGIKGTTEIYNNPAVVKYLGAFAFEDQLVLIAKYDNDFSNSILDGSHKEYTIQDQEKTYDWDSEKVYPGILLSPGLLEHTVIETELEDFTPPSEIDNSNESCDNIEKGENSERDRGNRNPIIFGALSELYRLSNLDVPNYEACLLTDERSTPQNNLSLSDVIIIITKNSDNTLSNEVVWNGYLDLDPNRKINMVGVDENIHYKRVYFTDVLNPLRTFNLKDPNLSYKKPESFDMFQDTSVLQPEIESVKENGGLKTMSVQYVYRLITENGQVSAYSPFSELVKIFAGEGPYKFKGGDVSEATNKSVVVKCRILDFELYSQIQCYALEYEVSSGAPTSIKTLGTKDISEIVHFNHNGSESDFADNTILAELLVSKGSWRYCTDLTIKKNRLIAGGLRNDAYPIGVKYMEDQFLLKGWNETGRTHDCLINPEPNNYKYIDPNNVEKYYAVAKTLYTQLLGFGNFKLTFKNIETENSISKSFFNATDIYEDFIQEVYNWFDSVDLTVTFPNLSVSISNNALLFTRTNTEVLTDLSLYQFESNSEQLIIEFDHEYELNTDIIAADNLVHGAVSYGYNEGTGIRLSWETERDLLMEKSNEEYTSGYPFKISAPTLLKGFMKGEIYRTSITFFKNGNPLFAIVLGDLQVPKIGDTITYIDTQGNPVRGRSRTPYRDRFGNTDGVRAKYKNQVIEDDALYAERVVMRAEVRLGCELKNFVDAYQIQYVERTEENRTILAQGISGPLQRYAKFKDINLSGEMKIPDVSRKWTLPYLGGPLHERFGFETYDNHGENYDRNDDNDATVWAITRAKRRIISNRRLMYFDSPDVIYDRISENLISVANAHVIGRLKTDHNRGPLADMNVRGSDLHNVEREIDPFHGITGKTFSRKLWEGGQNLEDGGETKEGYKIVFDGDDPKHHPYWWNFSVFSSFDFYDESHDIIESSKANIGDILPSASLKMAHEISNNALTHGDPAMNYSEAYRAGKMFNYKDDLIYHNGFNYCANISTGYKTLFLKTDTDLFDEALLGEERIKMDCYYTGGQGNGVNSERMEVVDTHALINLQLTNQDTVYGGRTRYAFSRNIFMPLSHVVPIHTGTNQAQVITVRGDTYTSLFMRTKSDFHSHLPFEEFDMNTGIYVDDSTKVKEYNRPNGWTYAVVLETTVEERMNSGTRQYRESTPQNFGTQLDEFINSAYYVTNNLKSYIPRPFNNKDNPLLLNIIAASKTKLSGDFYDSFSVFLANDFYEMEQQYGPISNITTFLDELYVIQSLSTNNVTMDPSDTITTDQGRDIQVATGSGTIFHSHKIISRYGTSIRRALSEGTYGFSFYDEHNNEFVKITEPLATKHALQLKFSEMFEDDQVVDAEGWFDPKYKESNIRLRTLSGNSYTVSYNEVLKLFNGYYDYNQSLYANFDGRVFSPKEEVVSQYYTNENSLHELNKGTYLNLFDEQKTMKLGIIVNAQKKGVKIFRGIEALINTNYPIKSFNIYDNIDVNDIRTIEGTHPRYKIREGIHTVPLQNMMDRAPKRGEWAYIEIEVESIGNKKVDLFSLVTFLRDSKI